MPEVRANSVLPAIREPLTLTTTDGLRLIGELAVPADRPPQAVIVCVHPLPTAAGMMDSHLFRKAAWRLPALADIAVLRFNTRGTQSAAGTSEGSFSEAEGEGLDVAAAVAFAGIRGLPTPWLIGWSFGTDVILKHPEIQPIKGIFLISPTLRFSTDEDLHEWADSGLPVTALIPELDDYLRPPQADVRFSSIPQAAVIAVKGAKHLWVGEPYVRIALNEIVRTVAPAALDPQTGNLPTEWEGPMENWTDL